MAKRHRPGPSRALGVAASSQVPARPGGPVAPFSMHASSRRAVLAARLLEKQCRRGQDGMREKALGSMAAAAAHPRAAPGYLDVAPRGLREVVTGGPARAKMPALCARQFMPRLYAQ